MINKNFKIPKVSELADRVCPPPPPKKNYTRLLLLKTYALCFAQFVQY